MSSNDFAEIKRDIPPHLAMPLEVFLNWLDAHRVREFLIRDVARDLADRISVRELEKIITVLEDGHCIRTAYRVRDNDGNLVPGRWEELSEVPKFADDRSGFTFQVQLPNIVEMAAINDV